MYEVDEQIMARTDAEFRQYVCDSLRALKEQQDSYEAQTKQLFELTQKIAEIVPSSPISIVGVKGRLRRTIVQRGA